VNFLEVGTQLRIRPFIYSDGTIRMEVHPDLSTGSVRVAGGLTLPDKDVTEVTTNIMCRDGNTVVIGGLIREELDNTTTQVPYFGSLPWVGPLFRHKTEKIDRRELIVLITPRITCDPVAGAEGERLSAEFLNREGIYADKMSPIGKRHLGDRYLRLCRAAWAAGDAPNAFRYSNLAIHFDPSREATNMRQEIINANPEFDASIDRRLRAGLYPGTNPRKDYSRRGYPWQPMPNPEDGAPVVDAYDPGIPGSSRTIEATPPDDLRVGKATPIAPPRNNGDVRFAPVQNAPIQNSPNATNNGRPAR
jgi:type IV pilus assembly protein PilQ